MADSWTSVVAGVVRDRAGRILISRRLPGKSLAGLWEFPGGKVDGKESEAAALQRELAEELGIHVCTSRPLITVHHRYPDNAVRLMVFEVTAYRGQPDGREGQAIDWVDADELRHRDMPAADAPVINAIRLPRHYPITGDFDSPRQFAERLQSVAARGYPLIQLRAKSCDTERLRRIVQTALPIAGQADAKLLLNGPQPLPEACSLVEEYGLAGIHLTARELMHAKTRPLGRQFWVGASCHNEAELRRAQTVGVDFVCLSPVNPTASHSKAKPLGWNRFSEQVDTVNLPVYALGGMQPADCDRAIRHGGQGIAGISAYWHGRSPL